MSARQVRKEATRNRVLEAARDLFESVGYEGTTVRMIARAAGVSVGSVFTTFASKRHVLAHIFQDRLEKLHLELNRVLPQLTGSTKDRLRSIFALHYGHMSERPSLFLAYIASTFDPTVDDGEDGAIEKSRLRNVLHGCLREGRSRGEVDLQADLELIVELLIAAYLWTYRVVARKEAEIETIGRLMDGHIGLIADGFAPKPKAVG